MFYFQIFKFIFNFSFLVGDLPPEGKACPEGDFVELPLDNLKKKPLHWQHSADIVQLPSDEDEEEPEGEIDNVYDDDDVSEYTNTDTAGFFPQSSNKVRVTPC